MIAEQLRTATALLQRALPIIEQECEELIRSFALRDGSIPESEIAEEVERLQSWITETNQFFTNRG